MLCTTAINTSSTIRTQTGAAEHQSSEVLLFYTVWRHLYTASLLHIKLSSGPPSFSFEERFDRVRSKVAVASTPLHTIRYDTRCYFNVRSKADMSRLIYRTETATTKCKTEKKTKKKKRICSEVSVKVWGIM